MFLFDDKFLLFRFLLILLSPKLKVVRILVVLIDDLKMIFLASILFP